MHQKITKNTIKPTSRLVVTLYRAALKRTTKNLFYCAAFELGSSLAENSPQVELMRFNQNPIEYTKSAAGNYLREVTLYR